MTSIFRGPGGGLLRVPGTDDLMRAVGDCCCDCCNYVVQCFFNDDLIDITVNGDVLEVSGLWSATGPPGNFSGSWEATLEGVGGLCCGDDGPVVRFTYVWIDDAGDYSNTNGEGQLEGCTQGTVTTTYTNEQVAGTDIVDYDCCGAGAASTEMSPENPTAFNVLRFEWTCVE